MSFPRYPSYKPSGVEWLGGEVPEHWDIKPLKRVATIQTGLAKGKEVEPEHCVEVPFLRVANVQDGFLDLEQIHTILIPEQSLDRYLLRHGDVLMNEGGDFDKLGRGAIWNGEIELCIHQNHVFVVRPYLVRPSWLNAYTSSKQANSYFISRSKQSTNLASISSSNLMELLVPVVPDDETTQILDFLVHETAKIDALIAEQQRLIELLQEKRQAVISQAVTKGLNPDAPMKDSGVEWLGEVPEHWEVGALSYALSAIGDVDHYMPPTVAEGIPYVMTGDLEDLASEIDFTGCKQISRHDYNQLCKKIKTSKGDLIMARYATIGTVSYVDLDLEFIVSYSCVTIRPKEEKALGRFLFFYLKSDSFSQGIQERVNTNTQGNVGIADLKKVKAALPPIEEQLEITVFLQVRTEEMGRVIENSEAVIGLLQERRSALISAAVTGQIDVRGLAPEASAA